MKTARIMKTRKSFERGSTLVIAMFTIAIIAAIVGVTLSFTSQNGVQTKRDQDFDRAMNAADGALEYAFASWKQAVRNKGLVAPTNSDIASGGTYAIAPPTAALHSGFQTAGAGGTPITFPTFSVVNANQWGETTSGGTPITNPVSVQLATIPGHPGWAGTASFYRATVTASVPSRRGPVTVTLARTFQLTGIPIFQAAIFFEHDIELHPGSLMIIKGLVHSNNSLELATGTANNLQFLSNVSYVNQYNENYNTALGYPGPPPTTFYPPIWTDGLSRTTSSTVANQLFKTERIEPFGTEPAALYNTTDTNPNNDGPRELIEPPVSTSSDPFAIASSRLYNKANVRVTIDRTKSGAAQVVIQNGSNANFSAAVDTAIRNAITVSTTTIYDWREGSNVALTNVDMKTLDTALVNMASTFNGVFYIQDITPTGLNAVRLKNGAVLNRDLSVVSNNAVYIQGDYNTGGVTSGVHDPLLVPSNNGGNPTGTDSSIAPGYTKRSTAVIADAVMMLSNSWLDANSASALASRIASHTTVNTAILGGIVPSNYQNSGVYSGGPHNFPRFLEDWGGKDFTYLGSMVQTFNSVQFDGIFGASNVYGVPGRKWGFDPLFLTQPPPGTLQSVSFSRGRWERQ